MEPRIRAAALGDAAGVAAVHVKAWQKAYRGLIDQELLDSLTVEDRAAGWVRWIQKAQQANEPHEQALIVATVDEQIAGWATFGAGGDEGMSHLGELAGLYVHPDYWSAGVGHALIAHVEQELIEAGWAEAYLWVLRGNDRAIRFYERHGWHADGNEKRVEIRKGVQLHELCYRRVFAAGNEGWVG